MVADEASLRDRLRLPAAATASRWRNLPGVVALRDSKDPHGPVLVVTPEDWQAFSATVKAGALGLR
jgi:hypothetical protein